MEAAESIRYSILVVDDDEQHRDLVTRCLEKGDHTLATAQDGEEAVRRLELERFDLVLLDYMMPRMNGIQVIETMMRSEKMRNIPIVVMTAVGDRATLSQCIAAGATDYITKPVEMTVVKSRVGQLLESRRYSARQQLRVSANEPVSGRILVVEDNEFNQDILTRRIAKWGCDAIAAPTGERAIQLLSERDAMFDLVMLDISMPGKDGFDVLAFIRAQPHLTHLPVIMVSAITDAKTVLAALKNGASDFVTKPFNAIELSVRVQNALRLKKMRDRYDVRAAETPHESRLDALISRRK